MNAVKTACLVVAVVACTGAGWGQELPWVFYDTFESGDTSGWWAPALVGETGQVTCYDEDGMEISCTGTGQDGDHRPGVAWPIPRFVDNGDGTVTDMLTGLVWLKNANCFGTRTWVNALADANGLASGACGLTDGSVAGDWRLPSRFELESLLDLKYANPALSNAAGTAQWSEGDAFSGVQSSYYWSSSSDALSPDGVNPDGAWYVYLSYGDVSAYSKTSSDYVWPVRAGQ